METSHSGWKDLQRSAELLHDQLKGELTEVTEQEFRAWLERDPAHPLLTEQYNDAAFIREQLVQLYAAREQDAGWNKIEAAIGNTPVAAHRVNFRIKAWWRYAAAVILLGGTGLYLWNTQKHISPETVQPPPVKSDKMPGTERAILTLANGQIITLDSSANGQLATENGSVIRKQDGTIVYNNALPESKAVFYNTMSTPRGGQYQIILADGTKAWLNAESAITFPTAFTGNKREVTIKGEVYFDVTKDAAKPFIVNINHRSRIEVLGTQFNVNAYEDERTVNTTLLEGAIKVWAGNEDNHSSEGAILKPGQEAQVAADNGSMKIVNNPDLNKAVAWTKGVFNFEDLPLEKAMRQLARWYDIQVVYEQPVREVQFGGTLKRNLPLSGILHFLEGAGLHYRLEGENRLVILNH